MHTRRGVVPVVFILYHNISKIATSILACLGTGCLSLGDLGGEIFEARSHVAEAQLFYLLACLIIAQKQAGSSSLVTLFELFP